MSNALCGALRVPCSGLRAFGAVPALTFRTPRRDLRISAHGLYRKSLIDSLGPASKANPLPRFLSLPPHQNTPSPLFTRFKSTATSRQPIQRAAECLPRDKPLSDAELRLIFGRGKINSKLGNRTLGFLHARRLEGTLDLDLPADIARTVRQPQIDAALQWLRAKYPIDEDAAILARIEREDHEAEQKLVRRAEQLGLYKPQSGSYQAELGEDNSVYGKSVLKEAREENEARLLDEKERKRREWLEGEHKERERLLNQVNGNTSLQEYQEAALMEGMYMHVFRNVSTNKICSPSTRGSRSAAVSCLDPEAPYRRHP